MSNKRLFPRLLTLFPLGVLVSFMIGCQGLAKAPAGGTTSGNSLQTSVNHIIFLAQENRSFDHYFGAMRQYWADYGYADQAFNGLAQFPTSSPSGPAPTNPGCDPAFAFPGSDCTIDAQGPTVTSYHLKTQCVENPSPSWNESHVDLSFSDPTTAPSGSNSASFLNGFVYTAAHDARTIQPPFNDVTGQRSMLHFFHALKKEVDRVCLHPPARSQIDNQTRTVGFPYEFFDFIQEKPAVQFALPLRQLLHDCGSLACHTRFPRLLSLLLADRSTPPRSTVTLRSRCSKRVPSTTAFRTFNPGAM